MPVTEFLQGLGLGAVAVLVAALATRRRRWAAPGASPCSTGLATSIAGLAAISLSRTLGLGLAVAVAGLALASAISGSARGGRRLAAAAVVATPFAWLLALDASSTGWIRGLVLAAAVVGSVAVARTDELWGPMGVTPALYATSAFGVFAAVPDTEEAGALLGAGLAGAVVGWPLGRARLGGAGAGAATGVLVWVAAVGGYGRTPSIVGAVACLGLLLTLPAGGWLVRRWPRLPGPARAGPVALLAGQIAVIYVAARVAGVSHHLRVSVPAAAAAIVGALVAAVALARR